MERWVKIGVLSALALLMMSALARIAEAPGQPALSEEPAVASTPLPGHSTPEETPAKPAVSPRIERMDIEPFRPPRQPVVAEFPGDEPPGLVPPGAVGGPVPESLKPEAERYKEWR